MKVSEECQSMEKMKMSAIIEKRREKQHLEKHCLHLVYY